MSTFWTWLATIVYPALFAVLGVYMVLTAIGRCVVLRQWQCVAVFGCASIMAASLALTTGVYALAVQAWVKPLSRVSALGIVIVLGAHLVSELRRMRPRKR